MSTSLTVRRPSCKRLWLDHFQQPHVALKLMKLSTDFKNILLLSLFCCGCWNCTALQILFFMGYSAVLKLILLLWKICFIRLTVTVKELMKPSKTVMIYHAPPILHSGGTHKSVSSYYDRSLFESCTEGKII